MIGEVNRNPQKKKPLTWNFFKKLDKTHAKCNLCHGIYSYQSTVSHLLRHVRKKHSEAFLEFKNQDEALDKGKNNSPLAITDEISMTSWPAVEVLLQTDESESGEKSADGEQSSGIWDLFTRIDDTFAECNLCQVKLPCKDSISDLTEHRELEHSEVLLKFNSPEDGPSRNGLCDILAEGNCSPTPHSSKDSSQNDKYIGKSLTNERDMKLRKSPAWQYFTSIDENHAQCKFCQGTISHRSCVSNLMRHVIRKHRRELLTMAGNREKKDSENNVDHNSADPLASQPTISDVEEESEEETSGEVNTIRRNIPDDSTSKINQSAAKTLANKRNRKLQTSPAWQYFTSIDKNHAQCKICQTKISVKLRSFSNLMRHVIRSHPCKFVARAHNREKNDIKLQTTLTISNPKDAEKDVDDNSADPLASQPIISDVEEESEEETYEEIDEIRKNLSDAPSSDQTSEFPHSKGIKMDCSLHEEDPVKETEWTDGSMNESLQPSQDQSSVQEDNTVTGKSRKKTVTGVKRRHGKCSSAWKNFIKLENGCSQCKLCGQMMSKNSYTSNLLRHMKRVHCYKSTMQREISEGEVFIKRPRALRTETGRALPIIHTLERETKSTSTQYDQHTDEAQPAFSSADTSGCLLSERLVHAVEEGNLLLRGLQSAVERQGDALNRLVACLEGMNQVKNNNLCSHST